ncbi:antitoxin [Janibacter sp. G56]|uniref:antitoxin n=1 Tax=Janibacter sp. G56 TaxID=3418717 RepID=UPI003D019547
MGIFDSAKDLANEHSDKIQDLANEHADKIEEYSDQGLEKAGDFLSDKTGGSFDEQIDQGREAADGAIGE